MRSRSEDKFLWWLALVVLLIIFGWHLFSRMIMPMSGESLVDTRLTNLHCWKWSMQYPLSAYIDCQQRFRIVPNWRVR